MSTKKKIQSKWSRFLDVCLLCIHILCICVMLLCGYSGYIHPSYYPWMVSAGLVFPSVLIANIAFTFLWLFRKRKYLLYSFAGFSLACVPLRSYFPLNWSTETPVKSIKVVSYNIACFNPCDSAHTEQIIDYIDHCKADILCLQELGSIPYTHKKEIDSLFGKWKYFETMSIGTGNNIGILTNYPILDRDSLLSSTASHGSGIFKLKIDEDTVYVVNSHFVSNLISNEDKIKFKDVVLGQAKDDFQSIVHYLANKVDKAELLRAEQADSLCNYIKKLGDYPTIMCGDFNNSPLSYTHCKMVTLLNDAYTRSGVGPGISYHEAGMYFRLDNILCSDHFKPYQATVVSQAKGSDHYPISCFLVKK